MRRAGAVAGAALYLMVHGALAQGAIQESAPIVPFHASSWLQDGFLQDAGAPGTPFLSALGLFGGDSCPFAVSSQSGPGVSVLPYSQFTVCQTATATTFNFTGVNGQATPNVFFNIGGVSYPIPGPIIGDGLSGTPANPGTFTAAGGETTLTIAIPITGAGHLILTRNGLYQLPSVDFTANGSTTVTFNPAAFAGETFRWVTQ